MKRQYKWIFNGAICMLIGMLGIFSSSFQSIANRMAAQFGQPVTAIGTYISVWAAGSFISVFFSGTLADRIGKKKVIIGAITFIIVGSLLVAVSRWQMLTLIGLVFMGMGFGPSEAIGSALLTDENPVNATRWMSISQICFCIGAIAAPIAAVWYCTAGFGTYQNIFYLSAIGFVVMLAFFIFNQYETACEKDGNTSRSIHPLDVMRNGHFRLYAIMIFLYVGYESIAPAYIKAFFVETGSTEALGAKAISLFWVSMIAGRLVGIFMNGKEELGIKVFPPIVFSAVCVLLLAGSSEMRLAGVILFGFGCGPLWPMLFVLSSRVFPYRTGSAYAVMMAFSSAGYMIFPVLLGSFVNNLRVTFAGCALLALSIFGLSFLSKRIKESI